MRWLLFTHSWNLKERGVEELANRLSIATEPSDPVTTKPQIAGHTWRH